MLTDVPSIDQKTFKTLLRFGIRSGKNILVLGPSGGGKTIMANEVCKEESARLVYVNLSVLERTDFQGFPVIGNNKKRVDYATPSFLEFKDGTTEKQHNALTNLKAAYGSDLGANLTSVIDSKIEGLSGREKAQALIDASEFLEDINEKQNKGAAAELKKLITDSVKYLDKDEPIVFLFDEADKAATETCQTLLEFLQFHSINGRKLNIKSCILTGNLPDEHAHVNNISHAISKRCLTFKLDLDFKQWQEWAFRNNVHSHVIQFLASDSKFLYKTAPDGDPTAYALPSPRTWTEAGSALSHLENDTVFMGMSDALISELRFKIICGSVGDTAGLKFKTWYQYYRQFDPHVNELIETGKFPRTDGLGAQEILIMALSACSKVYAELKPDNKKKIEKTTKHVYKWIKTLSPDVQMGAVRLSFGGDWPLVHKYDLPKIPEFVEVFKDMKGKLGDWDADLSTSK